MHRRMHLMAWITDHHFHKIFCLKLFCVNLKITKNLYFYCFYTISVNVLICLLFFVIFHFNLHYFNEYSVLAALLISYFN